MNLTIGIMFVPLHVGDHAGHVHGAEELGGVPHLQRHVLRGGEDGWQTTNFHWNKLNSENATNKPQLHSEQNQI